jgi:diguanylate cyclase (GGDEF)-like protein
LTEKKEIKSQILVRDRQIKHLENELKLRANVDMLTQMYNFQFVTESIANSIESYKEEGAKFCLLLVDIDDLKTINKIYGLKTGDLILQQMAVLLSSVARKIDVVGRYGNDEFMVILNNLDIDIAKIILEKLKQDIAKYIIKSIDLRISVSGALLEYSGETIEVLLNKLENMMEKANSIGKGTIIS